MDDQAILDNKRPGVAYQSPNSRLKTIPLSAVARSRFWESPATRSRRVTSSGLASRSMAPTRSASSASRRSCSGFTSGSGSTTSTSGISIGCSESRPSSSASCVNASRPEDSSGRNNERRANPRTSIRRFAEMPWPVSINAYWGTSRFGGVYVKAAGARITFGERRNKFDARRTPRSFGRIFLDASSTSRLSSRARPSTTRFGVFDRRRRKVGVISNDKHIKRFTPK